MVPDVAWPYLPRKLTCLSTTGCTGPPILDPQHRGAGASDLSFREDKPKTRRAFRMGTLLRFGLLALTAMVATVEVMFAVPLVPDPFSWCFGSTLVVMLALGAIAVHGCLASTRRDLGRAAPAFAEDKRFR